MAADNTSTIRLRRLTKRAQFLRAARGKRASNRAMALQMIDTADENSGIGFTVTKKTGNSPERSRIKRRLRAAADACTHKFEPQHDYVIIGRRAALFEPFSGLVSGLESLIGRVHANRHQALRRSE